MQSLSEGEPVMVTESFPDEAEKEENFGPNVMKARHALKLRCQSVVEGNLSSYSSLNVLYKSRQSRVWLATDNKLQTRVVIKAYAIAALDDSEVAKVRREMKFLMEPNLRHQYIVKGSAAFQDTNALYLVQEYASQGDLFDVATRFPKRQIKESIVCEKIIAPLCQAVAFLHSKGIIHRDIKPENVVVMSDGTTKLCDFGLAIDVNVEPPVSRVGTLEYMAPEIIKLPRRSDAGELATLRRERRWRYTEKVDIWALGCLAFEVLVGHSPFMPCSNAETAEIEAAICEGVLLVGRNPPPVSRAAMDFISATLKVEVEARRSAQQLLALPWVRAGSATLVPAPLGVVGTKEASSARTSAPYTSAHADRSISLPQLAPLRSHTLREADRQASSKPSSSSAARAFAALVAAAAAAAGTGAGGGGSDSQAHSSASPTAELGRPRQRQKPIDATASKIFVRAQSLPSGIWHVKVDMAPFGGLPTATSAPRGEAWIR